MSEAVEDRLLTPAELGQRWGVGRVTLWRMRRAGEGPAFLKRGHWVRYRLRDVVEWEHRQRRL